VRTAGTRYKMEIWDRRSPQNLSKSNDIINIIITELSKTLIKLHFDSLRAFGHCLCKTLPTAIPATLMMQAMRKLIWLLSSKSTPELTIRLSSPLTFRSWPGELG
jgi:hypothetical protein